MSKIFDVSIEALTGGWEGSQDIPSPRLLWHQGGFFATGNNLPDIPPLPSEQRTQQVQQSSDLSKSFVDAALSTRGAPYVWGAEQGTTGEDCSGLVYWAAQKVGIDVPRLTADGYYHSVQKVDTNALSPGDLVFFNYGRLGPGQADHVAVYIGNGQVMEASSHPGAKVSPLDVKHLIGAGRFDQMSSGVEPAAQGDGSDPLGAQRAAIASLVGGVGFDVALPNVVAQIHGPQPKATTAQPGTQAGWVAAALRQHESGGDYRARNSSSSASGAYQAIDSTWNGYRGYSRAYMAPPTVQDQWANQQIAGLLAHFGGDVQKVFASWYVGSYNAETKPWTWTPPGNSMSIQAYVNMMMQSYNGLVKPKGRS